MIDGLRGGGNGDYEKPAGPMEKTKTGEGRKERRTEKTRRKEYECE